VAWEAAIMTGNVTSGNEKQVFYFLSELLGKRVVDYQGRPVGTVLDLAGNINDNYPPVTDILLRRHQDRKIFLLSWKKVSAFNEKLTVHPLRSEDFREPLFAPGELLLKDTLLDKQVVDTDGAKIRRVNDLQFLQANKVLYLVHVDVGFKGLLRRVGLMRPISFLVRMLVDYELTDQLIAWKFVQPLASPDLLRLTVAQNRLAQLHGYHRGARYPSTLRRFPVSRCRNGGGNP
jgi:magnesium transporter